MALIIENPVKRPMVPPIVPTMSINLAASSIVIKLNEGVSKEIFTNLKLFLSIS